MAKCIKERYTKSGNRFMFIADGVRAYEVKINVESGNLAVAEGGIILFDKVLKKWIPFQDARHKEIKSAVLGICMRKIGLDGAVVAVSGDFKKEYVAWASVFQLFGTNPPDKENIDKNLNEIFTVLKGIPLLDCNINIL